MEIEKRVLIIDDDERNIFALSAVMRSKGYKIESALDGEKGLEILRLKHDIDIVLMDIMMPIMDGYETMKLIRADELINSLPIIALTAKAMVGDRERCIEAGATDYCSKPVDIVELLDKINECLKSVK